MKSRCLLKAIGLLMLLMFTTGIVLPWIISNVLMPVWMIIFTLAAVIALWVVLLESPYRKLVQFLLNTKKESANDNSN
jgi:hypothetical protein